MNVLGPTGGPIGIDEHDGVVWVSVDGGREASGQILRFDTSGKFLDVYLDDIGAPKDLMVWVPWFRRCFYRWRFA